jgi:hypothetical protein
MKIVYKQTLLQTFSVDPFFIYLKNQTSKSTPVNYQVIACTQNMYNFRIVNVLCIIAFVTDRCSEK